MRSVVFTMLFAAVALLRLYYCTRLPVNTGDTVRHICWGLLVNEHGYGLIDKPLLAFSPNLHYVSCNQLPFNYPILTLLFAQLAALLHPSIFTMKLLLTAIEFVNAMLVLRISRRPWLSWLYWASPISIWWASQEGQFEPLQNLFVLFALLLFSHKHLRNFAYLVLGLGVQVKLTAVFLLPYFVLREPDLPRLFKRGLFFGIAFLPTLLVCRVANPLALIAKSATLTYNPYYFNFFDSGMFRWNPVWLVWSNQMASYGMLAVLIAYGLYKRRVACWAEVLPAILMLVFIKLLPNAQFWYMMKMLPFLLLIGNERLRYALFLSAPLLDIRSSIQIVFGPFGWNMRNYYHAFHDKVFTNIRSIF